MADEPKTKAPQTKKYRLIRGSFTHGHTEAGPNRTAEGETCFLDEADAKNGLAAGTIELAK